MFDNKFLKNVSLVILSNGVKLIASLLNIFMLPLIFDFEGYGFYKLFVLFISYIGLFHFGFIDGIYLKFGGASYESMDKKKFKSYTRFLLGLQFLVAIIIFSYGLFFESGTRQIIILLVSLNLVAVNMTSHYQFISQITSRFKEFASRNIVFTILSIILIAVFLIFKIDNLVLFLLLTVGINYLLLFWYMHTYRDITFGNSEKYKDVKEDIFRFFKLGIPLLISNLVVTISTNLPKQFVEIMYPIEIYPEVFSTFSFAFSLLGFAGVFLTAVGLVIYPTLKQASFISLKSNYHKLNTILLAVLFLVFICYYPAAFVVNCFIPKYVDSLKLFFILVPTIALTSSITIIKQNYYKSLNKNIRFFGIGVVAIVLILLAIFGFYFLIEKNVLMVVMGYGVGVLLWFIILELDLKILLGNHLSKSNVYLILASAIFYLTHFIDQLWLAFIVYGFVIVIFTGIFFMKEIKEIIRNFKNKKGENTL